MHRALAEARQQLGRDLAVLLLPVPMDQSCNPHVAKQNFTHFHACRLARLGLIVWTANPTVYEAFNDFMFREPEPPVLGMACREAQRLLGVEHVDPNTRDPQIDAYISKAIAIYRSMKKDRVPMLLFPRGVLTGRPPLAQRLMEIVRSEFA